LLHTTSDNCPHRKEGKSKVNNKIQINKRKKKQSQNEIVTVTITKILILLKSVPMKHRHRKSLKHIFPYRADISKAYTCLNTGQDITPWTSSSTICSLVKTLHLEPQAPPSVPREGIAALTAASSPLYQLATWLL
jgi:hypothetical protein